MNFHRLLTHTQLTFTNLYFQTQAIALGKRYDKDNII